MKRMILATCVAVVLVSLATVGFTSRQAQAEKQKVNRPEPVDQFVPGRVLVKFHDDILPDHARNIIAALGARAADEIPNIGVHILDLPYRASEAAFVQAFQARPEVEFAELDRIVAPAEVIPNDLWYAGGEWHLPKISAPTAWSMTTGSSNIVIAILDTGVDGNHEDLAGNMVAGWNIYNNNSDTADVNGHGTNVAGAAAALSNNSLGVASVCWNCKIMPVRISDSTGYATYSNIASGLNWAADHGARVANISYIVSDSSTVTSGAQYFQGKGGVVAVSAGNYSTFDSAGDNPYVLTVSATDINDVHSDFSNYGNNVDLAAPEGVYTTTRGGGYMYAGGTSFSAPIVAGVAALVLSVNPNLTGPQVQDIVKQSADDLGTAGWDMYYGWGRVNAARAVGAAGGGSAIDTTPPSVNVSSPTNGSTVSGIVAVTVSVSDNVGVTSVSLTVDGVSIGNDTTSPYSFSWNTSSVPNGSHTLTATAGDAAGNMSNASVLVSVNNSADTTPPNVSITSPVDGATVSGNVSVTVSASDNAGTVTKVELYVDGKLKSTSTSGSFTMKWNTRKESAGMHVLQCRAYDAAGNVGTSGQVSVYK
jgi:thermitase